MNHTQTLRWTDYPQGLRPPVLSAQCGFLLPLGFAAVCLVIGHGSLTQWPGVVRAFSIGLLALLFCWYTIRHGYWQMGMSLLVLTHFCFGNNSGGLWNFVGLTGVAALALLPSRKFDAKSRAAQPEALTKILLFTLLASNIAGWLVRNQAPLPERAEGASVFVAFIVVFWCLASERITKDRAVGFLTILGVLSIWMFFVGVLQKLHWNIVESPLLGSYSDGGRTETGNGGMVVFSVFDHVELYGEYAALVLAAFLPFVIFRYRSTSSFRTLSFFVPVCCVGSMIMSASRSSLVVALIGIAIFLGQCIISRQRPPVAWPKVALLIALCGGVFAFGSVLGTKYLMQKFSTVRPDQAITVEGVISGDSIDRGLIFPFGQRRILEESWWIGFGFGLDSANRRAWLGSETGLVPAFGRWEHYADLHNLYFQVVILYGWFGAAAFFGLILVPIARIWKSGARSSDIFVRQLAGSLCIVWVLFLLNEWKIAAVRSMNYHMLMWIWLGVTHAVSRNCAPAVHEPLRRTSRLAPERTYASA